MRAAAAAAPRPAMPLAPTLGLLALAALPLAGGFAVPPAWGLAPEAARALGVTVCTVVLWWSRLLPLSVTALAAVALLLITGVAGSFGEAAVGFASDTVFFLLAVNQVAEAAVNAGLVDRLMRAIDRRSGSDPRDAFSLVTVATGAMALIIPSALVRIKVLLPVIERMSLRMGPAGRRFKVGAGLVGALLGPVASISVMTGGGMSIVAARILEEFHRPLNWLQWLAVMSVPNLLTFTAVSLFIWRAYGSREPLRSEAEEDGRGSAAPAGPLSGREWLALGTLAGTLVLWMVGERWGLPLSVPPVAAAALLALPPVGLVTAQTVQRQKWDEIMVVGSALCLSDALARTGAIQWLADRAFALFPQRSEPVLIYLAAMVFAIGVRQLFLQPSPGIAITMPIVIEIARITGVDPLFLALITAGVMGVVQILPVQSPPSLVCLTEGVFDTRDELRVAPVLIGTAAAAYLLAATAYWPLLRWLHVV